MKKMLILLFLISASAHASETPLSGTFSNASKNYQEYMSPSLSTKINLVVTLNESGQQFFIQCFKDGNPGFGVITEFNTPKRTARIKAGTHCPAKDLRVELDYEEAFVRSGKRWAHLLRGDIYLPIVTTPEN